jgi:SnoaL-like domain
VHEHSDAVVVDGRGEDVRAAEGRHLGFGSPRSAVPRHDGDLEALRQLCLRYAAGVDGRDAASFLDVFTANAEVCVYEPPGTAEQPDRVMRGHAEVGRIVERIAYYSRTIHVIEACSFEIDGETACGRVECVAHHFLPSPQDDIDRTMHVRYEDDYRRDARGEWRIERRTVRIVDREDVPAS